MKLNDAVRQIDTLDPKATLFVRPPWAPSSDAALAVKGTEEEERLRGQGLSYFLEVAIARNFLIESRDEHRRAPTTEAATRRLIKYASNEA